ncbi:hypothetical protein COO60DRAFT_267760 [Scenedesmus sp. NREL 46B-D3]|nr:hypothetical protein COO60DRAFT_267760 [Scenedesmus sp. NREL 46B-D3]
MAAIAGRVACWRTGAAAAWAAAAAAAPLAGQLARASGLCQSVRHPRSPSRCGEGAAGRAGSSTRSDKRVWVSTAARWRARGAWSHQSHPGQCRPGIPKERELQKHNLPLHQWRTMLLLGVQGLTGDVRGVTLQQLVRFIQGLNPGIAGQLLGCTQQQQHGQLLELLQGLGQRKKQRKSKQWLGVLAEPWVGRHCCACAGVLHAAAAAAGRPAAA